MANGYDTHSLKLTGITEAVGSAVTMAQLMPVAVRDRRFTRRGIGYRTQEATSLAPGAVGQNPPPIMYPEGSYAGGTAARRRGAVDESQKPWGTAQEATRPQIRPRDTLERSGLLEALPPWLRKKGEGDEGEQKEAAAQFVRENMGGFPCEEDARIALAVLSQFVDGDTLDSLQQAIEDQYGDPAEAPPIPPSVEPEWAGSEPQVAWIDETAAFADSGILSEAPLTADKRDALPDSDFAIPGNRSYPIDTPERARAALARVKAFGKEGEEAKVIKAVKAKYPDMKVG